MVERGEYRVPTTGVEESRCRFYQVFREKKGFPRFKSKSRSRQSYKAILSVHVDQERRRIKLPKIGWVKYGNNRKFEGDVRSVTVSVTPSGKYHVSVLVDDGKELPENYR